MSFFFPVRYPPFKSLLSMHGILKLIGRGREGGGGGCGGEEVKYKKRDVLDFEPIWVIYKKEWEILGRTE